MADENEKKPTDGEAKPEEQKPAPEPDPIQTQHRMSVRGEEIAYTATVGRLPLKNAETGEPEAHIFFTAYTRDDVADRSQRPLTFAFNGGPGSASVWLHLGALGPKRVVMEDEGWLPRPPFRLEDNPHTWLDETDLVFIDPVGTGYSRAVKEEHNKQYWSLSGDLASVGDFIRLYLTRYERWTSPLMLAGESYGTTRAAGLAGALFNQGIAFNAIVLISTVMNFQTLRFTRGNDLPYLLYIPTYAATAWYHGRLADAYQQRPIADFVAEVQAWTETTYNAALLRGDSLPEDERAAVRAQLAAYTGLPEDYIAQGKLRVEIMRFCKALLRDEGFTVGRLDSRFKGIDDLTLTEYPEFDPSMSDIMPPYTATFYDYVRRELGYESDDTYEVLNFKVNIMWEYPQAVYPDTSEMLRAALAKNPYLKVLVAQGYYDLATPHYAAHYTLNHMGIDPRRRANVSVKHYEAGHMFYLDTTELGRFREDVRALIAEAIG